jgi:hypothetical protein
MNLHVPTPCLTCGNPLAESTTGQKVDSDSEGMCEVVHNC